jgi:uncharacterized RDD family membrane protein YckC
VIVCPRCRREAPRPAPFCAGCGAPLVLGDEKVRPLDVTLDLDRRGRRASPGAPAAGAAPPPPAPARPPPAGPAGPVHAGELAEVDRSHWDLGRLPRAGTASPEAGLPDAEVEALEVHVARADPWRRAVAWAVDVLPFAVAGVLFGRKLVGDGGTARPAPLSEPDVLLDLIARERVIVLSLAAALSLALGVYATVAHALAGATLGKRLLRIRVVGPDGKLPSPGRSAARSALAIASGALLGLGFLLALFTRSGRALHDLLARTWVVKAP